MEKKKAVDVFHEKLDRIEEKLADIDKTLVKQHSQLEHHIYRTNLAEDRIQDIEDTLIPLVRVKYKFEGAFKVFGIFAAAIATAAGIVKIVSFFS